MSDSGAPVSATEPKETVTKEGEISKSAQKRLAKMQAVQAKKEEKEREKAARAASQPKKEKAQAAGGEEDEEEDPRVCSLIIVRESPAFVGIFREPLQNYFPWR